MPQDEVRNASGVQRRERDRSRRRERRAEQGNPFQSQVVDHGLQVAYLRIDREVSGSAVGEPVAATVVANHAVRPGVLSQVAVYFRDLHLALHVAERAKRHEYERRALAELLVGDADAIGRTRVADRWLFHRA
ncbi:MAG: hypothetical protein WEB52_05670 [Dehalococcoidia bacterium]